MSGFLLNLTSQSQGYFSTGMNIGNLGSTTVNNLSNGDYYRQITATDKAGNHTTTPLSKFTINVSFTGNFGITSGININSGLFTKASTTNVSIYLNKATQVIITGDTLDGYTGINLPAGTSTLPLQLSAGDGVKKIYFSASTGYQRYNNIETIG